VVSSNDGQGEVGELLFASEPEIECMVASL
jgi:hypothetical protein